MAYPNDPFYLFGRNGSKDNPYKNFNEPLKVFNNKTILTEIPFQKNHVVVKDGSTVYGEVYSQGALSTDNNYFVDYDFGVVYFDPSHNGKQLTFTYTGMGYFAIPATRIYSQSGNAVPTQNLQDMIDNYNQLNGTDLYTLFDPQTGHKHSGASGDAPPIDSQYVNYTPSGGVSTSNVRDTLYSHDTQLNENEKQLGANVIKYGAIGDGATQCDTALTNAKTDSKNNKIYFPQNDSNNAVYYFSNNIFDSGGMDGYHIEADKGVVISVPTLNSTPLKNVDFQNYIQIYARDRDDYANAYPNLTDFEAVALTNNDYDLGFKVPTLLLLSGNSNLVLQNFNGQGTLDSSTYIIQDSNETYANGYYIDNNVLPSGNIGLYHAIGTYSIPSTMFSMGFFNNQAETSSNTRLGVAVWKDYDNFALVTLNTQSVYFGYMNEDKGVAWSEQTEFNLSSRFTTAYGLTGRGFNIAVRQITNNSFDVLLNGVNIGTFTVPFPIKFIGGCINHDYGTNIGIANWHMLNPMYENVGASFYGDSLNIATFGDSITQTEGSSISWADFLTKTLKGQKGITKVTVSNQAISGQRSDQQLTIMQSYDFSNTDVVCILIGTNDILQGIDVNTFKSNLQSMITLANPSVRKVIIGVPPLWTTRSLSGTGTDLAYWDSGIQYRECVKYVARNNQCILAETDYDLGNIDPSIMTTFLRDNLHPNALGESLISKSFARSILRAYVYDPKIGDAIEYISSVDDFQPIFQNGWDNVNSDYMTTIIKEKNGMVHINGSLKPPSLPVTMNQTIFTLPTGCHPEHNLIVQAINTTNGTQQPFTFDLNSAGVLSTNISSITASDFISFSVTFKAS